MFQAIARRKAISLWFHYRVTVERDREKWGAILDENFLCVMPITPYRSFPPAQVNFCVSFWGDIECSISYVMFVHCELVLWYFLLVYGIFLSFFLHCYI